MKKIDEKTLKTLRIHVKELCTINEETIQDKIENVPKRKHELFVRLAFESNELNELELQKKQKYGELYKHYKYEDDHTWESKGEIESQIYANNDFLKICRLYNNQLYIVKELEGFVDNLSNSSYQIKNTISLIDMKLKFGLEL